MNNKKKKNQKIIFIIIENLPTILTIIIGAIVVLKNLHTPYDTTSLLGWIITILWLIASSMLIERLVRLRKIEKNVTETNDFLKMREGKISLDDMIITRKNLTPLEDRLKYSKDIRISGASLFRLATEYMGLFEEKAKEGCNIRFLLLNPLCEATKLVATNIVYEVSDISVYVNNINNTINSLRILQNKYPKNVEVRIVDFLPAYSLVITDADKESGVIRLELYTQLVPTRDRPQLVFHKNREPQWYTFFLSQFDKMWDNNGQNI